MKALYQSTWYRFVLLLTLAALLAAGAAVPVGAVEETVSAKFLLANDIASYFEPGTSLNINTSVVTANCKLGFYIDNIIKQNYTYVYNVKITITRRTGIFEVDTNPYQSQLYSNILSSIENNINNNIQTTVTIEFENNTTGSNVYITCIALINAIDNPELVGKQYYYLSLPFTNNDSSMVSYVGIDAYAVYDPGKSEFDILSEKLDVITNNQNTINENLINIIQNQITQNNNWQTLITYGNEYNQIDQTTINKFGSAQDNLSSAEGALQDKSQSLRDGVSSQWQNNINTTKNFVGTITPATTAITSTITQIVAVMPEEVQALLVVIPLLLFIGWLIGRIEGG